MEQNAKYVRAPSPYFDGKQIVQRGRNEQTYALHVHV